MQKIYAKTKIFQTKASNNITPVTPATTASGGSVTRLCLVKRVNYIYYQTKRRRFKMNIATRQPPIENGKTYRLLNWQSQKALDVKNGSKSSEADNELFDDGRQVLESVGDSGVCFGVCFQFCITPAQSSRSSIPRRKFPWFCGSIYDIFKKINFYLIFSLE